jgi:hypothetical protein
MRHTIQSSAREHPLWGQLSAVYEASSGQYVNAEALTLTVAIESLLGTVFPSLGRPSPKDIAAIREAQAYLREWNGDESIKNRIAGSVGQLMQPRALDRMRGLAAKGAITDGQWKAWQRLRNPSAHSYLSPSMPTTEFIKLIQKVEVLFYHLVFYAIGYKGPYMDFASPGWPLRDYP